MQTGSRRVYALASAILALGALPLAPAGAQTSSSINGIESEIKTLQRELQELKREMAAKDAAVRAARQDAQQAKESAAAAQAAAQPRPPAAAAPPLPPGYLVTTGPLGPVTNIPGATSGNTAPGGPPAPPSEDRGTFHLGGVTVTLGGFLAAEGRFATKNQSGDLPTSFTATPFNQTPLAHEAQTTLTARQSRFSLLAFGDPTPNVRISGYYEMDFLAGSSNGNNTESNGYAPRVRQLFAALDYDDRPDDMGLHILAGQAWSLVTPNTDGILPRKENVPLTIDPQYNVGFTWARQAQLRLSADFLDHRVWAAISAESPQTTFTTSGYTSTTGAAVAGTSINELTLPTGGVANINNPGISPDYSGNNFSVNGVPDFVGKIAVDPGFGHYEALGVLRVLTDRAIPAVGVGHNNNSLGGGVGANADIRVFSGLDLLGNVLVGDGIGRYGSGQLSDATVKPNGTVSPIPQIEAMIGAIGHPVKSIDLYGYLGTEQESKTSFTYAGKGYGDGSPLFVNTGCGTELSTATCTGNTQALYEGTLGVWWRPYTGTYGTLQTGAQYSHILREAFYGVGGKPQASEDVVFLSFRYYPFQ